MIATIVDTHALVKVVWVSLAVGIGVTTAFSLAVFGVTRGGELRRSGRALAAVPLYVLTVATLVACGWALWQGYDFVVTKS